jgi:arylformamidase
MVQASAGLGILAVVRRILDISLGLGPDTLIWPDNPPLRVIPASRVSRGDASNVSDIRLGSHTGTHIDPPAHFDEHGLSVDRVPLDVLMGPAVVADLTSVEGRIEPMHLDAINLPEGTTRLLLKTPNSSLWQEPPRPFTSDYVSVSPAGAGWIVERGIRLVGVDFLSVEPFRAEGRPTHRRLLDADVVIVEGLDLSGVEPGGYWLACLPLRLIGGDGGPARAVLISDDGFAERG